MFTYNEEFENIFMLKILHPNYIILFNVRKIKNYFYFYDKLIFKSMRNVFIFFTAFMKIYKINFSMKL